jgi:hypothetical protein
MYSGKKKQLERGEIERDEIFKIAETVPYLNHGANATRHSRQSRNIYFSDINEKTELIVLHNRLFTIICNTTIFHMNVNACIDLDNGINAYVSILIVS